MNARRRSGCGGSAVAVGAVEGGGVERKGGGASVFAMTSGFLLGAVFSSLSAVAPVLLPARLRAPR